MVKKLTQHGDSLALVIDRSMLELLSINADTPLEVTTDGKRLVVEAKGTEVSDEEFQQAAAKVTKRYEKTFRKLAE